MHIVVLLPVLNDWASAGELLSRLDSVFAAKSDTFSILLVDDGSTERPPAGFGAESFTKLGDVSILRLKKNLGHQRTLAIGLCHIADKVECDAVIVMDSDGEDSPTDAARLLERMREQPTEAGVLPPIIFAERSRRSESFGFRLGYIGYRILHRALTGRSIRYGNFSIIPRARLGGLAVEPMLWNHYAASVAVSRIPIATIPSERATRLAGKSHQSFVKLVIHGLSALSCYSETVGVRLLLVSTVILAISLVGIVVTLGLRLVTSLTLPGWTSLFAGILIIFLFQVITLASTFTMQIINTRTAQTFLPARDYLWYIDRIEICSHRV